MSFTAGDSIGWLPAGYEEKRDLPGIASSGPCHCRSNSSGTLAAVPHMDSSMSNETRAEVFDHIEPICSLDCAVQNQKLSAVF